MGYKATNFRMSSVFMFALILAISAAAVADVKLPAVIGDNMVLQQKTKAPIWGWADPGEKVSIKADWQKDVTAETDKDGKWMVKLQTPSAGGPYSVQIKGKNEIVLKNVLVGEVWICAGQSNMQMRVSTAANAQEEIAAANYPKIRMFNVKNKTAVTPQADCEGSWLECSSATVSEFSAVGYFFGRELNKKLNVPVGLINTSWGGAVAETWTRKAVLESEPDFKPILERYDGAVKNLPTAMKEYEKKLKEWENQTAAAKADGKPAPKKPIQPNPDNQQSPSALYNAMVAPLIPYYIRGVIWYQGESNARRAYQYRKLFPAMIKNWRDDRGEGQFPFLFVQITPFKGQNPEIREAQLMTMRSVPDTGMVVTTDIGDLSTIHPKNKQEVGRRLALWALAKTYGEKDIVYSGPIYKSMKIEGDKIRISFDYTDGGLIAKGDALTRFTIAGEDRQFVDANAVIDGDTIVVSSAQVKKPVAVRFGWTDTPQPNLFNKAGLPASPFRTDDWPGITADKK